MKTWPVAALVLTLCTSCVVAGEVEIVCTNSPCGDEVKLKILQSQKKQDRPECNGMYSKTAWGGDTDPFIEAVFVKTTPEGNEDPLVSIVVYEWKDEDLIGVWPSEDAPKVRNNYG